MPKFIKWISLWIALNILTLEILNISKYYFYTKSRHSSNRLSRSEPDRRASEANVQVTGKMVSQHIELFK